MMLYFNVKEMYQLNLIENAFSLVRSAFRKRDQVDTAAVEKEAKLILHNFLDLSNDGCIERIFRNHLRNLSKYLTLNSPSIERD